MDVSQRSYSMKLKVLLLMFLIGIDELPGGGKGM